MCFNFSIVTFGQARSLPTDKLRIFYISINVVMYVIQVCSVSYVVLLCIIFIYFISQLFLCDLREITFPFTFLFFSLWHVSLHDVSKGLTLHILFWKLFFHLSHTHIYVCMCVYLSISLSARVMLNCTYMDSWRPLESFVLG